MKRIFTLILSFTLVLMNIIPVHAISGEGTDVNPFLISTEEDFLIISDFPSMSYKLMADVTITSVLSDFNGTLDGNGHTVTTTQKYIFSSNSGTIKNLSVSGGILTTANSEEGFITNCNSIGVMLTETNNGIIKQSYVKDYCICYENNGLIDSCFSTGEIIVSNKNTFLKHSLHVYSCIAILNNKTIQNTYSDQKIIINDFIAQYYTPVGSSMEYKYYAMAFGGIVYNGSTESEIIKCSFVGDMNVNASKDDASTQYPSSLYLNGIGGSNIINSFSKATLNINIAWNSKANFNLSVNGIGKTANNSYSNNEININSNVNSTYGHIYVYGIGNTAKNCYSSSKPFLNDKAAKTTVLGIGQGSINSYFLSEFPIIENSNFGTAVTSATMKTQSCYNNWDFENIWAINSEINDGYPYLQWQYEKTEETAVLDYTVNSIKILNANNEKLETIPENGNCYVEINMIKNTDRNEKDYLIIASYDNTDMLIDFTYMRGLYNQNQEFIFDTLLKNQGIKSIKAFVWDGLSTMQPLSNTVTYQ